MTKTDRC